MNTTLRRQVVAAALLLLPVGAAFVAAPAAAQQMPGANLAIATANLSADYGLKPGSTLKFQVTATAGARSMRVTMGESGVRLSLRETRPGVYEGQHVVTRDERLDPRQLLTVTADYGSGDVARAFYYPSSFQSAPVATTPPPTAVAIERFMLRPGPIESGRPLYYRVTGARGGQVHIDIPGVVNNLELNETRPGFYEGIYTVRRGDDPAAFPRAVATLRLGTQRVTARIDPAGDRDPFVVGPQPVRDERAPTISDISPADGERVFERRRTHISARLADDRSGVDPASVRIFVNAREVTRDARIDADSVHYARDLSEGRHRAELIVRDRAGNTARRTWTFEVRDRGHGSNSGWNNGHGWGRQG